MPRRRMIDPEFWTDSKMAKATRDERLLFIGLFTNADDVGRIMASPTYLKSIVFPYDDDVTPSDVKKMRDHLIHVNPNVALYKNADDEYIQLRQWERYQKPRYTKPSKYPPPTACTPKDEGLQPSEKLMDEGLQPLGKPNSSAGKVILGRVINPIRDYASAKAQLKAAKNKIGFLVECFNAFHAHAPPEDFKNLGGRIAQIAKSVSNDYGYVLKLIYDTGAASIAGSHLNYIQGRIRSEGTKRRRTSTDEEIARSLK